MTTRSKRSGDASEEKDFPLILRRSFEESKGGPHSALREAEEGEEAQVVKGQYKVYLADKKRGFPPRHEFSLDWLLENGGLGFVRVTPEEIHLTLTNGSAVYTIDRSLMQDENGRQIATGYWGILKEQKIHG